MLNTDLVTITKKKRKNTFWSHVHVYHVRVGACVYIQRTRLRDPNIFIDLSPQP